MINPIILKGKMQSKIYALTVNLLLTLLVFFLAQFGQVIGLHHLPLAISVLWPAAGLSLAAILLFGNKALYGVLLGNLFYNFYHLSEHASTYLSPFMTAAAIATGSTLQAWLSSVIIKTFSSEYFLKTVRDVFIFLIPAGVLTCMIASTIGVTALSLFENMGLKAAAKTWFTFWLGDSIGVYIVTPLIIVWLTQKPKVYFKEYAWEVFPMLLTFAISFAVMVFGRYFLGYLFIPLCLWVTYRYRMHGATLCLLIITLSTVLPNSFGYGAFFTAITDPLFVLISFLLILIATCLIFAATVNEKEAAWGLLQEYNVDLQDKIKKYTQELKDINSEIFVKEKLASLGVLTAGIAREFQLPLSGIVTYSTASKDCLLVLQDIFKSQKEWLGSETSEVIRNNFETLQNCLDKITQQSGEMNRILDVMQKQINRHETGTTEVKTINLHTLIQKCLAETLEDWQKRHPKDTFTIEKNFYKGAAMIPCVPEDLSHAFVNIFDNAFYSMSEKRALLGNNYEPILSIRTIDTKDSIEIFIKDNGFGIPKYRLETFFQPFSQSNEGTGIALPMAHDIIEQEHHGKISVDSIQGKMLEITISLPKIRKNLPIL